MSKSIKGLLIFYATYRYLFKENNLINNKQNKYDIFKTIQHPI